MSLSLGARLGSGSYGTVYKGKWDARPAALKTFRVSVYEDNTSAIQHEVRVLESLKCRHVIQFFGTATHQGQLVIVTDYAEGGSLKRAIDRGLLKDWSTKMRIAQEVASGLAYIHLKHILHRDLKSANVLLTKYMEAKLCDFGLALVKTTSAAHSTDTTRGTTRWMAPELLGKRPRYSTKSDVYALGMVMWEMAANCTMPFKNQPSNEEVARIVERGEREDLPDATPADFRRFVEQFWRHDPSERPEACEMVPEEKDEDVEIESNASASNSMVSITDSHRNRLHVFPAQASMGSPIYTDSLKSLSSGVSAQEPTLVSIEDMKIAQQKKDFEILSRLAMSDVVEAQVALAAAYEKGEGTTKDSTKAFDWYHRAASKGHVHAQHRIGEMYMDGRGTPRDETQALAWWQKAADRGGFSDSQVMLGEMYQSGRGVRQSNTMAAKYYRKAAENGHAEAQHRLGMMFKNGRGVKQSNKEAVIWLRKAAEQGVVDAQRELEGALTSGQRRQLGFWIRKVVDQGEAITQPHSAPDPSSRPRSRLSLSIPLIGGVRTPIPKAIEPAGSNNTDTIGANPVSASSIRPVTERTGTDDDIRTVSGGTSTITSTTRIITENDYTGKIRYIIVGGFSGNAIRVIERRSPSTGETELVPTNDAEAGTLRHVLTERSESGEIRYIIGGVVTGKTITKVIIGPRIVTEKTSTGEDRYVIVDQYGGNAIRTKFEINPETGEWVHIPVKEPEGVLRYVNEERTESGEIRKVIGAVVTGNVKVTTRTESGGVIPSGASTSTKTRILAETDENGVTRYYQITRDSEGEEVRMQVERTKSGNFRTLAGALITSTTAGGVATKAISQQPTSQQQEQINTTQITLKLSIMRYERTDAKAVVPAAAIGTVLLSKFKKIADGDVNIHGTAYTHVEEISTGERRTVKWMRSEAHWKREAGMIQHLNGSCYVPDIYTLYSLPAFAEYRYLSIIGSFSQTLESYISTEHLSLSQICLLALSLSNALRWCHEHHVVHLNINPVSFYLAGVPGQDLVYLYGWKLWNFGYARFVGEAVAVDTSVANAMYAAPEILNDKNGPNQRVLADPSMDRWSLGVVLCEVFTHKKLFRSGALAELQLTGTENSAAFEPDLSSIQDKNVKTAIRGLIEVDAEKRFGYEKLLELLS